MRTGGIVTVTAAAAVDRTYTIDAYVSGGVNRARSVHRELSGKGVNVALAVGQTDVPVLAVVPLGRRELLGVEGDAVLRPVPIGRDIRVNVSVVEDDGTTTKINEGPTPLAEDEWRALVDASLRAVAELDGGWLVLCGTLPRVIETGELVPFEELLDGAAALGVRLAVDTSGEALHRVLRYPGRVHAIKPNTHELAEAVGRELDTVGDVVAAAQELRTGGSGSGGIETVYVSMGADGALVVGEEGYFLGSAVAPAVVNTVGAGDASLAGFLVSRARTEARQAEGSAGVDASAAAHASAGADMSDAAHANADAARTAAAWGALAVSQTTTVLADPGGAPEARVTVPDPSTPLTEPGRP
ncbi:1-phosphofructokinase family hexose kinase [Leucobacter sp. CSA1]|uniref:1-phosphofructokinase family hexose kinase n=1 Tax=Leucobacter chromiisoli TaxID=2796471 RepID=A0A934UU54_9MICO|nr:1-phosphofructokinase family hexose kinase [Leucobacter chromiisoli]MBK0418460.1 1-phosphofructokinase family hexose kinase [Leucobacter chromiisoli]